MMPDVFMSEATLVHEVGKMCFDLRLLIFHDQDSRRTRCKGFPDLVIAGPNGILYREVKDWGSVLQPYQRKWGSVLHAAGGDWAVWRPQDLLRGVIAKQLVKIAAQ